MDIRWNAESELNSVSKGLTTTLEVQGPPQGAEENPTESKEINQ